MAADGGGWRRMAVGLIGWIRKRRKPERKEVAEGSEGRKEGSGRMGNFHLLHRDETVNCGQNGADP